MQIQASAPVQIYIKVQIVIQVHASENTNYENRSAKFWKKIGYWTDWVCVLWGANNKSANTINKTIANTNGIQIQLEVHLQVQIEAQMNCREVVLKNSR